MIDLRSQVYPVLSRIKVTERQALMALQRTTRLLCRETLRLRGNWTETVDDTDWSKGFGGETYHSLTPVAPSLEGTDSETKTYGVLRVLKATLGKSTDAQGFLYLKEIDLPRLRALAHDRMPVAGAMPEWWADADGTLVIYPGFDQAQGFDTLYVEAALTITSTDFEKVLFPPEYEDALVNGALAECYQLAGPYQNLDTAKAYAGAFQNDIARLRGQNLLGTSGAPGAHQGPFHFHVRTW